MMHIMTDSKTDYEQLLDGLRVPYVRHADLSTKTWYRVGGSAGVLASPGDEVALGELMGRCHAMGVAVYILGKGANLLVLEGEVDGVVIQLEGEGLKEIEIAGEEVTAGGGTDLAKLINLTAREGLGGLDVLAGIPATVGGAIRMNAGGAYGEIGTYVKSVRVMNEDGSVAVLRGEDIAFEYRNSGIMQPIVLSATFGLKREDAGVVRGRVMEVYDYKKQTQPLAEKSAGCAFKNPAKDVSEKGAGQLIDEAGLKGYEFGSARVSNHHANFIVVEPGGRARDIFNVMKHVERVVQEKHGISLVREVVVWGNEVSE